MDPLLQSVDAGQNIRFQAVAGEHRVIVTDRRLSIATDDRLILDVALNAIRRIQFDIERDRPATMVVVPEHPQQEPQVLAVRPRDYDSIGLALAAVGRYLANGSTAHEVGEDPLRS
jgi:hypothetical protein